MCGLPAWPYPKFCAHRGAGKLAPENTLAAFRVGYESPSQFGREYLRLFGSSPRKDVASVKVEAHAAS